MRDTIYALFDGPYLTLGMSEKRLKAIRTPTLMMPGNNDIHPRSVAEQVHRLISECALGRGPAACRGAGTIR